MHYPGARLTPKKKKFSGLLLKKFIKLDFKNEPTQKFFDIVGNKKIHWQFQHLSKINHAQSFDKDGS